MLLNYLDYRPAIGADATIAPSAVVVGRTVAGAGLVLRDFATLRGDGEWIRVGEQVYFGARSTVHIADGLIPARVGDDVTVGRYALVHACTIEDRVVIGDTAVVMDGAVVGADALVAAGALVPPRKTLEGGWIYAGNPAAPVRRIEPHELAAARQALREERPHPLVSSDDVPPISMAPYLVDAQGSGPLYALGKDKPTLEPAFVAANAVLVGNVHIGENAGVFFGCALAAGGARIVIGARSNIQDNSLLLTDAARGDLLLGSDVTVGHNARIGAAHIADDALIGMGSEVGDGVVVERGGCVASRAVVEPGTIVRAGWIWAGRPAREFRPVKTEERELFGKFLRAYVEYSEAYRKTA